MKDASPRIFRHLAHTGGRDGFDTIVGAAVASYGSLRAPTERQARDFARLVVPLWDKVSTETRRSLAAALAKSPRVPRDIVDRLLAEPIEVFAPFMMSSPIFSEAELKALALGPDRRLRKLIAERKCSPHTSLASRLFEVSGVARDGAWTPPSVDGALAEAAIPVASADAARETETLRQPLPDRPGDDCPTDAPSPDPDRGTVGDLGRVPESDDIRILSALSAPAGPRPDRSPDRGPATIIRETLRRLALPGRRPVPSSAVPPSLAELVAMAVRQNGADFYDGLSLMLGLRPEVTEAIAAEPTGERLAIALKALDARSADAMTILMMMKPSIGLDVEAFERMTRTYRVLRPADCAALVEAPVRRLAAPALAPHYQDLSPLHRGEARPVFGRRKVVPAGSHSGKQSA